MNTTDIIIGLDIGTTKICVLVGRKNEFGKIELLGMGKAESLGVIRGVVANIDRTVDAIKAAVAEAENRAGISIKSVNVGIAGQHIKSYQHRGIHTRNDKDNEICKEDLQKLKDDMGRLSLPIGEQIIDVLPQEYMVDNEPGIKDPVGMSGIRLEANFHIITGQVVSIQNIQKCVEKAGLKVASLTLEPLASSAAVLSEEEKEAGIALVDIGGGTTDIAIFQDNIIRHTAIIPFGGNIITEDIKEGCTVMRNQAEKLKINFGSALAMETSENEMVSIPGLRGREAKEISVKNLAHIIQARMEEILEHVYFEIKRSGYEKKLIGGIVVTGGGAQLKHLVHLVQLVTGMDARIGYPTEYLAKSIIDEVKNPTFSTGVGLIIQGIRDQEADIKLAQKQQQVVTDEHELEEELVVEEKPKKWFDKFLAKADAFLKKDIENEF